MIRSLIFDTKRKRRDYAICAKKSTSSGSKKYSIKTGRPVANVLLRSKK